MNTSSLPTIIQARLKVAAKIKKHYARAEEINRILNDAKLYYPQCFTETYNNQPKEYTKTSFEKYIDSLKPRKYTFIIGD